MRVVLTIYSFACLSSLAMVPAIFACYFALEIALCWYGRAPEGSDLRRYREKGLIVARCARDLLIMHSLWEAPADIVYSHATQRVLVIQGLIVLALAITVRVLDYVKKTNAFRIPASWLPWFTYLSLFLRQPSTTAVKALVLYPLFLLGSWHFQENIDVIRASVNNKRDRTV